MNSIKRTKAEWLALVRSWEESGESQRAFCSAQGVKLATFTYWRGRYLREEGAGEAGFVALRPQAEPDRVRLRVGGLEVELAAGADFVAEVLLKLAGRC